MSGDEDCPHEVITFQPTQYGVGLGGTLHLEGITGRCLACGREWLDPDLYYEIE